MDDRIAILEAEIVALKFAVIALAFRLDEKAPATAVYGATCKQPEEALH